MKYTLSGIMTTAALILAPALSAQTTLFNFGSTSYSGTNAPGHVDGTATGTSWNAVAVDKASGILDQDGNATGIALDFGTSSLTGTTVNYSNPTKAANVASTYGQGVLGTALISGNTVRDGSNSDGIALNISGLAAGSYTFYLTAFRGDLDTNAPRDYNVYAGVGSDAITDFSSLSAGTITNSDWNNSSNSWTAGDNYITGTFTIDGTNDNFSILVTSSGYVGVLSSLELVSVPEPTTYSLIFGSVFALIGLARRRRA